MRTLIIFVVISGKVNYIHTIAPDFRSGSGLGRVTRKNRVTCSEGLCYPILILKRFQDKSFWWLKCPWYLVFLTKKKSLIFFLILALRWSCDPQYLHPTNFVQNSHFRLTPSETHCLNLFLDCSSPGGFRYALLSFPFRSPSKSYLCDSIERNPKNMSYYRLHLKLN